MLLLKFLSDNSYIDQWFFGKQNIFLQQCFFAAIKVIIGYNGTLMQKITVKNPEMANNKILYISRRELKGKCAMGKSTYMYKKYSLLNYILYVQ